MPLPRAPARLPLPSGPRRQEKAQFTELETEAQRERDSLCLKAVTAASPGTLGKAGSGLLTGRKGGRKRTFTVLRSVLGGGWQAGRALGTVPAGLSEPPLCVAQAQEQEESFYQGL